MDALAVVVGGAGVASGLILMAVGHLGGLRFADVYTRSHGINVADGAGATVFILGLGAMAPETGLTFRLLMLAVLVWAMAPLLTHLTAAAAHFGGIAPRVGARSLGGGDE